MTNYEIKEITKIFRTLSNLTKFKIFLFPNKETFCVNTTVNFTDISIGYIPKKPSMYFEKN